MKVVVAGITTETVAGSVLRAEGIDHAVVLNEGDHGFGRLLDDLFRSGEGFILVEDDMAPWPGAINKLRDCEKPWCSFDCPVGEGRMVSECSHWGLAIFKINAALAAKVDTTGWRETHWYDLDHRVNAAIRLVADEPMHIHAPPIGHARHHRIKLEPAGVFFE